MGYGHGGHGGHRSNAPPPRSPQNAKATPEPDAKRQKVEENAPAQIPRLALPPTLLSIYRATVIQPFLVRLDALLPLGFLLQAPALAQLVDVTTPKAHGQEVHCKVLSMEGGLCQASLRECDQDTGRDLNPCPALMRCLPSQDISTTRRGEGEIDRMASTANPLAMWASANSQRKTPTGKESEEAGFGFGFGFGKEEPKEDKAKEEEEEENAVLEFRTPKFLEGEVWRSEANVNIVMEYRIPKFLAGLVLDQEQSFVPPPVMCAPEGSMLKAARIQLHCLRERRAQDQGPPEPITLPKPSASRRKNDEWTDNGSWPMNPEWVLKQRMELTIYGMRTELMAAIEANQVLVVIGETGSGKTTQLAQYLVEDGFVPYGFRVGCTQPRRIAAISVARRVAQEVGCPLGTLVGYAVRFEDATSSATKIKFMTDGLLLREVLADRKLSAYAAIIIDEAHERALSTDILFGLLKDVVTRRPNLKVIITSATLDAEKFSTYFRKCPIIRIPGRSYPVDIIHAPEPVVDYVEAAATMAMKVHSTEPLPGDILVFLTGQEEIEVACRLIQNFWNVAKQLGNVAKLAEVLVLPIYAALAPESQLTIFEPAPAGVRKIVVATNIAETSLTIAGIKYVVDSGFAKQKMYDAGSGIEMLTVVPISQSAAKQRAGRAGRMGPGKCYRLYTEVACVREMPADTIPEICRSKLGHVVLTLKAMGIPDLLYFDFLDPPSPQGLIEAMASLHGLGALDDEGNLTKTGRRMADFPLEPQLSRMLLAASELGCAAEVLIISAMLSAGIVFQRPRAKQLEADACRAQFVHRGGDHLTYLTVFRRWERTNYSAQWCFANFINTRAMTQAFEIRGQLADLLRRFDLPLESTAESPGVLQKAICCGYFMHVARRAKDGYITLARGNTNVLIHPTSVYFEMLEPPPWLIYHELLVTSRGFMRDVLAINPRWLPEVTPAYFDIRPDHAILYRPPPPTTE